MAWFRVYDAVLDNPAVQLLPPEAFKHFLLDAMRGKLDNNPFSDFLQGPYEERPYSHEWAITRERVFDRDNHTCQYCGAKDEKLECDHVVPVARGGGHDDGNLITACFKCNRAKRDKLVKEWLP